MLVFDIISFMSKYTTDRPHKGTSFEEPAFTPFIAGCDFESPLSESTEPFTTNGTERIRLTPNYRRIALAISASTVALASLAWGLKGTLEEEGRITEVSSCVKEESNGRVNAEYDPGRGAFTGPTEHMDLIAECEEAAR